MKSSAVCPAALARFVREEVNVAGVHPAISVAPRFCGLPSFEPTVLKYPAEKPPVNAPCSRFRPRSSRTCRVVSGLYFEGGMDVPLVSRGGRMSRRRGLRGREEGAACQRRQTDSPLGRVSVAFFAGWTTCSAADGGGREFRRESRRRSIIPPNLVYSRASSQ
jgi:hypothetical protein